MKRTKESRISVKMFSRKDVFFGGENVQNEEKSSTPSERMLDNLKRALFFSQVQCQMGSKERG